MDARFGMFSHWSPAAVTGLGAGGWNIAWGNITWEDYYRLARSFSPVEFDAPQIAKHIKSLGAKYIVFTTKHHAGFSMWDTELTGFNIKDYYGQDLLKPLCDALREENIKVGFYFSAWDWNREEYRGKPRESTGLLEERGGISREEGNPLWPDFLDFYLGQAEELLTGYGQVDVLWIDGWKHHNPEMWASGRLWDLVREKQPQCILNDRWGDSIRADYVTWENRVPETPPEGLWETCYRANKGWFYTQTPYMSPKEIIRMLIDCVSKNGNLLLNFPLNARGSFDREAVDVMEGTGDWLKTHGEAVYGCGIVDLDSSPFGRATCRPHHIYLHLYGESVGPGDEIRIENLKSTPVKATLLASGKKVRFKRKAGHLKVTVPEKIRFDPISTIIDLEFREEIPETGTD